MDSIEQLRVDLMFLAKRQRSLEIAIEEWSEFITTEILRCGLSSIKDNKNLASFRGYLKDKFKEDYEKFEILFSKVNKLYDKKKRDNLELVELVEMVDLVETVEKVEVG